MSERNPNDDNRVNEVLDAIENVADFVRENQDLVQKFTGDGSDQQLELREPLSDARVSDDKVVVNAELRDKKPEEMGVRFEDGTMYMDIGDLTLRARVPDDIIKESVEASMNNGVLRVEIKRANRDNMTMVDVEENVNESIVDPTEEPERQTDEGTEGEEDGEDGAV